MMKYILLPVLLIALSVSCYSKQADTLRILVLSPGNALLAKEVEEEYNVAQKDVLKHRQNEKAVLLKRKEEYNGIAYNSAPTYQQKMMLHDIAFMDSLTLENTISFMFKELIALAVYRDDEGPKILYATAQKAMSDKKVYAALAGHKNMFIINFPSISIYKEGGAIKVTTVTEVYSSNKMDIIYKKEAIGTSESKNMLAPVVRCNEGSINCALLNSVNESLEYCTMLFGDMFEAGGVDER